MILFSGVILSDATVTCSNHEGLGGAEEEMTNVPRVRVPSFTLSAVQLNHLITYPVFYKLTPFISALVHKTGNCESKVIIFFFLNMLYVPFSEALCIAFLWHLTKCYFL